MPAISPRTSQQPAQEHEHGEHRRAAWRQRLVQAERGLVKGVRSDSVFFVHFFGICVVLAAGLVLGIGPAQWLSIAICLTVVLTSEMFNQALKSLAQGAQRAGDDAVKRALAMGTAAVMVASSGSSIVVGVIFWQRLEQLLAG